MDDRSPDELAIAGYEAEMAGNLEQARRLYTVTSRARDGSPLAMTRLGMMDRRKPNGAKLARELFERAADKNYHFAMVQLAILDREGGDDEAAMVWWQRAVKADSPVAVFTLASEASKRGADDVSKQALKNAAEIGDVVSLYAMADALLGIGQDAEGETLHRRFANLGNTFSMWALGRITAAREDAREAWVWYRTAADDGNSWAAFDLGVACKERDQLHNALFYLEQALEAGFEDARQLLDEIDRRNQNRHIVGLFTATVLTAEYFPRDHNTTSKRTRASRKDSP